MQTAYQNGKSRRFWRSESLHFPGNACLRTPYLIMHQKVILPYQNTKFLGHLTCINKLIKNDMAVLTWYTIQYSKYFVQK